jgi:hypothetical protein
VARKPRGRPFSGKPLREIPVQLKMTEEEDAALTMVQVARGLPGKSLVLREMSLRDAVEEAKRLRKELAVSPAG